MLKVAVDQIRNSLVQEVCSVTPSTDAEPAASAKRKREDDSPITPAQRKRMEDSRKLSLLVRCGLILSIQLCCPRARVSVTTTE